MLRGTTTNSQEVGGTGDDNSFDGFRLGIDGDESTFRVKAFVGCRKV